MHQCLLLYLELHAGMYRWCVWKPGCNKALRLKREINEEPKIRVGIKLNQHWLYLVPIRLFLPSMLIHQPVNILFESLFSCFRAYFPQKKGRMSVKVINTQKCSEEAIQVKLDCSEILMSVTKADVSWYTRSTRSGWIFVLQFSTDAAATQKVNRCSLHFILNWVECFKR